MSATSFTADLRDIRFVLHEQLEAVSTLGAFTAHAELDRDVVDTMIDEAYRVATEVLSPINARGDRQGCSLDGEGNVSTPDGYKEAWNVLSEGGWHALTADPAYGGMGMPSAVGTVIAEFFTGASTAFSMYGGLSHGAANLLAKYGPETLKQVCCEKIYTGEWAGTMCLTEAGAGSDVGANRARALATKEPGVYDLTGEKVFISCGDNDFTENILHLVLARTPDAPDGTRGLSIFVVPKYDFDAEGNIGERNGAYVEAIEHKMGINGSATCTLILGGKSPCKGYILGKEGEGMKIMFHMMNEARLEVGIQGLSGAAAAYQNALSYSKDRIQGSRIEETGNDSAQKVAIIEHPDVRRMLLWQKVHVETMRSLVYKTALRIDLSEVETDEQKKRELKGYVELMTPVVKAYCSDKGFESAVLSLQTYGGYGYIGEYPVEQIVRDTKIASIYEGTNGIQALDLLGRKMQKGGGVLFMNWLNEVNQEIEKSKGFDQLGPIVTEIEKARDALGATAMHLGGLGMQGRIKDAMLQATPFLDQFGCVALAVEALEQARVALGRLQAGVDSEAERRFYKGKLLNARFYVANVLPRATALGKTIRSADDSCLDAELFA